MTDEEKAIDIVEQFYDIKEDSSLCCYIEEQISEYVYRVIVARTSDTVVTNTCQVNVFTAEVTEDLTADISGFLEKIRFTNGQAPFISDTNLNKMQTNTEKALQSLINQKILFSCDGIFLTNDETVNLSEKISKQKNGIVLVWSAYASEVKDYWWEFNFIPKEFVGHTKTGNGCCVPLFGQNFNKIATKYFYLSDTYLKGHEANNGTGTSNGITYANDAFVLRYVLGI